MTPAGYKLLGFAAGGADVPPYFMEPVFASGDRHYVQASSVNDDEVQKFVEYDDDIEILEGGAETIFSPSDGHLYALRDTPVFLGTCLDRIICGDRIFVSRYLSENLVNYTDYPYFLTEVGQFLQQAIPELSFIQTDRDVLEAAVLANSVRRFCRYELAKERSRYELATKLRDNLVEPPVSSRWVRLPGNQVLFDPGKESIFSRWLNFAENDAHRLCKFSRWSGIDKVYLRSFSGDELLARRYYLLYWFLGKSMLSDSSIAEKHNIWLELGQKDTDSKRKYGEELNRWERNYLDYFNIRSSKLTLPSIMPASRSSFPPRKVHRVEEFMFVSDVMVSAFLDERVSRFDISMLVYFISLVCKFRYELHDDEHA